MVVINAKKLYIAYLDCRKNKRNTENAIKFEFELEKNLHSLLIELQNESYTPGKSTCFVVRHPKPREIFAANFRDRIVHHLLVNELLEIGERNFIHDSYACRVNKGTHKALHRLRKFLRRNNAGQKPLYFLQLDIDAFFMNIDKNILFDILLRLLDKQKKTIQWKCEVSELARKVIFHNPTKDYRMNSPAHYFKMIENRKSLFKQPAGKGLPIGNYSSQFFANLYMNELDQFVKRKLNCKDYIRYVDDFILLHHDPNILKEWMKEIKLFAIKNLKLNISERKIRLQEVRKGIDFLGYFVKPNYTLARKAVVSRFKRRVIQYKKEGIDDFDEKFKAMKSSYFGHFSHANCSLLMKKYSFTK